jgi:hypothetical protein
MTALPSLHNPGKESVMKFVVLTSIILTAAVAAGPAHASSNNSLNPNGIKFNSLTNNGINGNGIKLNAFTSNGTKLNAFTSNGIETGGMTVRDPDRKQTDLCVTGAEPACEQTSSFSVLSVRPGAEMSLRMH